jgi:hypothetical protein
LFQHEQVFTATDVANYATQASDGMYKKGGFFWTKYQWDLIQRDNKRVLFTSQFGTGKTLLLKSKAKALTDEIDKLVKESTNKEKAAGCLEQSNKCKKSKCFFIVFTPEKSILTQVLKQEFEAYWTSKKHKKNHIEVLSFFEKGW